MSDTYTYPCECTNCDHAFEAKIEKGKLKDGLHKCPRCGCTTGEPKRKSEPMPMTPYPGIWPPQHWWDSTSLPPYRIDVTPGGTGNPLPNMAGEIICNVEHWTQ